MNDVTRVLAAIEGGDPVAAGQPMPLLYDEVRQLAAQWLAREKPGQTLQATALVHEAYLRLGVGAQAPRWESRAHVFGAAAEAVRRILVERAHKRRGALEGRDHDDADIAAPPPTDDLLALGEARANREAADPDLARLLKLRDFAGLTDEDTAQVLGRSRSTVQRRWRYARALLLHELEDSGDAPENPGNPGCA